jgi:signal transduction histidine kinase
VTAERELEAQSLRRRHQLLALNRISSAVSGLGDLDAILQVALDTVLEIINGTIGGILLLDEKDQRLRHRVHRGLSAKFAEDLQLRVGEGIVGEVALSGEPMLVRDVSEDKRTARRDLVSAEGLRGLVCVPLKAKNAVLGVMHVASHVPAQFTSEDMYLLDLIASQLGTAIEQARLCEGVSRASERYQALLQHVLTAQESERKRIARELHDETSQMLTGLALHLQAIIEIASVAEGGESQIVARLKKAHALTVETSLEITRLINDLRPTLLDSLGLAPAIQRYVETWLEPVGIDASVKTAFSNRLPSEVEVALFRITQEAINNIIRHSEARHAKINLECDAEKCTLRIHDDGVGFDTSEITRIDKRGRGVGVFSMKERVALVGGSCAIESQPGEGTHITVKVPLPGSVKDAEDTSAGSG